MIFGITLNRHGWRIGYLGADTPVEETDPGRQLPPPPTLLSWPPP